MTPDEPQPFGKYLLLERIATGGMAEIFRAKFTGAAGVTKPVVIKKILPPYVGNPNFVSMFINEAKITVGLSHGNIAQVFDFGEIEGEYFLAMEFVDGQPLSKVIRRSREVGIRPFPIPLAVLIASEICKGLHYAHTRHDETGQPLKIIHRDVSPQNVIVSYEGQVKLVDFGIAKVRNAGQIETQAGAIKGKYTYFSPEQAQGIELDARTDVFATGVILFELSCGRLPFEGKMVDVLAKIVRGDLPRPSALNPSVSPALERILMRALATHRDERFPSSQAFQEALSTYLGMHAPAFAAGSIGYFVSALFEQELLSAERPVNLPPGFREQMRSWRDRLPDDEETDRAPRRTATLRVPRKDPEAEKQTRSSLPPHRIAPSQGEEHSETSTVRSDRRRRAPQWLFWVAPLAAMVLAAATVLLVEEVTAFSVRVVSDPPGAEVIVDGVLAPEKTPLLISNLSAARPHAIELRAAGRTPWKTTVLPTRGSTIDLDVRLPEASPGRP